MPVIVFMGVSASGKSTVAALLAKRLHVPFCEGDDLHPARSVAKMRAGLPLDDRDRAPWLARVAGWIGAHPAGGTVSCSVLKRRYRDRLRQAGPLRFVLLDPPRQELERRLMRRRGHFMPARLLGSQLAALERPARSERTLRLAGRHAPATLVGAVVRWLAAVEQRHGGAVRRPCSLSRHHPSRTRST